MSLRQVVATGRFWPDVWARVSILTDTESSMFSNDLSWTRFFILGAFAGAPTALVLWIVSQEMEPVLAVLGWFVGIMTAIYAAVRWSSLRKEFNNDASALIAAMQRDRRSVLFGQPKLLLAWIAAMVVGAILILVGALTIGQASLS